MKNRRAMVLRELGLTPVWRVDEGVAATASVNAVDELVEPATRVEIAQTANDGGREASDQMYAERAIAIAAMPWPELKTAVSGCTACPLHRTRKQTVFGVGDENAAWLFVGEGPGADEDAQGEPFVGQAGKLLDNMLMSIGLRRGQDVYIANIVKCRPPGNRNPEPAEARACAPYLARQIALIKPRLIVALGKVAAKNLLGSDAALGSLRGRLHEHAGVPVIVTYHPAYLLRSLTEKARAWKTCASPGRP